MLFMRLRRLADAMGDELRYPLALNLIEKELQMKKYIFENGVMKLNPHYQSAPSTVASPNLALPIISSTSDIAEATAVQEQAVGKPMQIADATIASMQIMQDQDYITAFKTSVPLDGGCLLDGISNYFSKYEVPIGLVNKLLALTEYRLNFIIDDSGSMGLDSDVAITQASQYIKQKADPQGKRSQSFNNKMTRWEEAEDRLHILFDILAYLPISEITLSFLNRSQKIVFKHEGLSPEQFANNAHQQLSALFQTKPNGGTPLYKRMSESLQYTQGNKAHYIFTDGQPSDATIDQVSQLVLNRANPRMSPITFMSCTDDDNEAAWMKEVEGKAPYTAELDDFESEKKEVLKNQGPVLPFSRGFWLICQLVAVLNPIDLDALDEPVPFSKQTLDNLMGFRLSPQEYQRYFQLNPNAAKYANLYQHFAREDVTAAQILKGELPTYTSGMSSQTLFASNNNLPQNATPMQPQSGMAQVSPLISTATLQPSAPPLYPSLNATTSSSSVGFWPSASTPQNTSGSVTPSQMPPSYRR